MFKRKNNKKGFTIVELTVVVSVIAILSAVLIPMVAGITKKANQSADEASVRKLNEMIIGKDDVINNRDDLIEFFKNSDAKYDISNYTPASKGFSFVYSEKENAILLLSDKGDIVYPEKYAGKNLVFVTFVKEDVEEIDIADSKDSFANGGVVAVKNDILLENDYILVESKDLTVDLTATVSNLTYTDSRGVFTAGDGATITLNGDGTVDAKHTASDYSIAVWARGGDVVINGGTYTNMGTKTAEDNGTPNNCELIYATKGGKITINGGIFMGANTKYVLNCRDNEACMIVVQGGKYLNYNPATMANDKTIIFNEDKYKVVETQDGEDTWYEVVKK